MDTSLDGVDNLMYNLFRRYKRLVAQRPVAFGCVSCLLNTEETFDAFASGYGCQNDCGVER